MLRRFSAVLTLILLLINTSGCEIIGPRLDEFVLLENMGSGINLGNSLDCVAREYRYKLSSPLEFETYWHNPEVNSEWFSQVKKCGFNSVRIPVSWGEHLSEEDVIDPAWMNRVREVVDMALSNDLYVILDMHHEDWLMPTYEKEEEVTERLTGLWKQIASEFKDHSLKLLFEGMNEPRLRNTSLEWSEGTAESYDVINHLNSAFIKTVRSTGGNNTLRYLLITDYAGSALTKALENLEYPEDDNIIVSIHCYLPHSFTSDESGSAQWNSNSEKDTEPLRMFKNDLIELFLKKGVPVLITEYGCSEKKSGNGRMEWTKYFTNEMKEIHIHTMWWDNGGKYSLIDRESCEPSDNELIKTIVLSEKQ